MSPGSALIRPSATRPRSTTWPWCNSMGSDNPIREFAATTTT
jgi:hypothetical protein